MGEKEKLTCSKCDATFACAKYVKKHESAVGNVDISMSNYFQNLPMVIKPLKSRIYRKDFKEKDDKLPSGWRFKIRETNNPQYTGGIRRHKIFLTPGNRTVHTGLGVIEYLRLEEKFGQGELWSLAQHLGIEKKKFERLWSS